MKITDYPSIQELKENNIFLVDGPGGTKQLTAKDLAVSLTKLISMDRETYLNILDEFASVEDRKTTFGGRNLGDALTKEQAQNIVNGTFKGFFVGDYWEKDDRTWRIVDIDYWLNTGDEEGVGPCKEHHLVIMPDKSLAQARMNETNSTSGGYTGSEMVMKTFSETINPIIMSTFSNNDILTLRGYFVNTVSNGYPAACHWADIKKFLPNEPMMCGTYVFTPAGNGNIIVARYAIDKSQLALMQIDSHWINPHRDNSFWLRDIASASQFVYIHRYGNVTVANASSPLGVRPVFAITGAETAAS